MIRWGLFIGTTSGIVLGLYMWFIEKITGDKVYTLLMNVDFIPWFGSIDWPVLMEWFFHMIISWVIGLVYAWLFMYRLKPAPRNQWDGGVSFDSACRFHLRSAHPSCT